MSWSIYLKGKASKVSERVGKECAAIKCLEPEETVKNDSVRAVRAALDAYPPDFPVEVAMSGSQSYINYNEPDKGAYNTLSVKIEPIHGFVD